jgi:sodium-dependent dicarboxylate transporter 2/3/5
MQKHGLDEFIALSILEKTGTDPKKVLLGLMAVTAFLSMWMSNTASTAIMLPIGMIILAKNKLKPLKSSYGKALALGIAYAATIGGIGTIVGTPPNAIAVKFLADNGVHINFLQWMYYGLPVVLLLIPIAWVLMLAIFKPEVERLKLAKRTDGMTREQKKVGLVFIVTAFLWLTTPWHGVASSTIAIVPIILLYALNLLAGKDFRQINWGALILVGSGLSLGTAIHASHLDAFIASLIELFIANQPLFLVLLLTALFAIALTVVAANTATAAVLVPIVIPLALSLGLDIKFLAILVGIAVSLDFIVPVGTPPSAIAYSSGYIKVKDMVKAGIPLSLIGAVIVSILSFLFW